MRAINWKVGVRRLYLVGLVPYLAAMLLIASDTPKPIETFLILCVVAFAAYCLLEMLIWALSGFAVSRPEPLAPVTMDVEGRTRTFQAFDVVHAQRFHLVDGDGKLQGYLAVDDDGPALTLTDGEHVRLRVGLKGGNPHVMMMDDQVAQVRLLATDSGTASVTFSDSRGDLRAAIGVNADGSPYVLTWTDEELAESKAEDKPPK